MASRKKPILVVVFIPALNEEEKIGSVITAVKTTYKDSHKRGFKIQVLVVDDGCTDKTVEVARRAGADRIISHPQNLGLGAGTRSGMREAYKMGADIALKMDADFQHDPLDIEKVIEPIMLNRADLVFGSRFAGKINYRMPIIRYVGNKTFTWLMRLLTGWKITDAQTGLMVYARAYLAVFSMPGNYNPPQQTLIDAFHKKMRYAEVPVVFHPRTTGKSFVSLKYPFKVATQIIQIFMITAPLKVFMPIGLLSLGAGCLLGIVEAGMLLTGALDAMHKGSIIVLILFGIQALFFGFLADLVIQTKN